MERPQETDWATMEGAPGHNDRCSVARYFDQMMCGMRSSRRKISFQRDFSLPCYYNVILGEVNNSNGLAISIALADRRETCSGTATEPRSRRAIWLFPHARTGQRSSERWNRHSSLASREQLALPRERLDGQVLGAGTVTPRLDKLARPTDCQDTRKAVMPRRSRCAL